jgi:metal-responsive CopG/Arc/MetJ family transcriptional regulator
VAKEQGQDDGPSRVPTRSVRIPDELWNAAQEASVYREEASLSHVIRRMLSRYVRDTNKERTNTSR